ncbi:pseudouridine synthase [Tuberibacillus sp. Marseille-P3662]|uniref:pseudouridine synthase n=1 Tax=Tuberibacillus sp. Marseille-P3662 TaxID=1965358 RepID=UPI000A1CAA6F|nr:pseudouridine synthase [Tuberibacillus sp. Marseille-P3662]
MERLQKMIAKAGIASRRKAEQLITDGQVTVNGRTVTELGTKVAETDKIEVNGVPVEKEEPVYLLFYKPTSVISSVKDDRDRKVVTDYLPEIDERVFPIGRLDYDTSGVLLLTNDGDFANKMMHPSYKVEKEYIAKIKGIPSKEDIRKLQKGVKLEDGVTAPAKVKLLSSDKQKQTAIIQIIIAEGKNRQVRRMFAVLGYDVIKLKRERYGSLTLGSLNAGDYRMLKPYEIKQLYQLAVT